MQAAIHFITLGVRDLSGMTHFYKEILGWQPLKEMEGISFFLLNGVVLGLYPVAELADDIGVQQAGQGFKSFTLAQNFSSRAAVDAAFAELTAKGVNIVKPPQEVFWGGYSGYFADPENNYWELAHNPFVVLDENNRVQTHL